MELESYQEGTLLHIGSDKGGKLQVNDLLAIIGKSRRRRGCPGSAAFRWRGACSCTRCRSTGKCSTRCKTSR